MIPVYYRCNDPTGRCERCISKEIVSEKGWDCPCNNPDCESFREAVPVHEVIGSKRIKLVALGLLGAVLALLLLNILFGGDALVGKVSDASGRLSELNERLYVIEAEPRPQDPSTAAARQIEGLAAKAKETAFKAREALDDKDAEAVATLLAQVEGIEAALSKVVQSAGAPSEKKGSTAVEAKALVLDFQDLEADVEKLNELALQSKPSIVPEIDVVLTGTRDGEKRAAKLAAPSARDPSALDPIRKSADGVIASLARIKRDLGSFEPPVSIPFQADQATLRIGSTSEMVQSLILPLISAWTKAEVVPGANGESYIDASTQNEKILVVGKPDVDFADLANGKIDLVVASRDLTNDERELFSTGIGTSRTTAEVIALDALTLVADPASLLSVYRPGESSVGSYLSGAPDSPDYLMAAQFGFRVDQPQTRLPADAVIGNPSVVGLGLYHSEGANIRAKRLAVQPSPAALQLKPSPFTIATEDYRYAFRIVAWNGPKPKANALDFVKFVTSDAGQEIVAECNYVDLRLRPMRGDVDPLILAAIGEALGIDSVSSATRLSTNFRFAVNEDSLDLKAQGDIERLPRQLARDYATQKTVILGFTDSTGGPEINLPLSKKRAASVAKELKELGVDASTGGLGDQFPVDTNETEEGKARNRRAEVWVARP